MLSRGHLGLLQQYLPAMANKCAKGSCVPLLNFIATPHWDTTHATGSTLLSPSLRSQQPARPSSVPLASSSNVLVTNCKAPRLTDKQSDTQVYLTLVALKHASGRLDFGQMTSTTSAHTDLSVPHWHSTVFRSQLTSTPEIYTVRHLPHRPPRARARAAEAEAAAAVAAACARASPR